MISQSPIEERYSEEESFQGPNELFSIPQETFTTTLTPTIPLSHLPPILHFPSSNDPHSQLPKSFATKGFKTRASSSLIAKTSFDDEEKESGAWNGNRNVSERSRNEAVALSGGGNAAEGLDGRTACGDGCEGTGQQGDEKVLNFLLLFSFFIRINSNAGMIERMAIVFHSPIPPKPPLSPPTVN